MREYTVQYWGGNTKAMWLPECTTVWSFRIRPFDGGNNACYSYTHIYHTTDQTGLDPAHRQYISIFRLYTCAQRDRGQLWLSIVRITSIEASIGQNCLDTPTHPLTSHTDTYWEHRPCIFPFRTHILAREDLIPHDCINCFCTQVYGQSDRYCSYTVFYHTASQSGTITIDRPYIFHLRTCECARQECIWPRFTSSRLHRYS